MFNIINSGFKNQFETNKSSGILNDEIRWNITKQLFGSDVNTMKPSEFEKYGFLGNKDIFRCYYNSYAALSPYGSIMIKLKKETLIEKTTYTIGDSLLQAENKKIIGGKVGLNSNIGGINIDKIGDITEVLTLMEDDVFEDATNVAKELGYEFWELQYHGEITIDNVESITFDKKPEQNIIAQLKDKKIKVYLLNVKEGCANEI